MLESPSFSLNRLKSPQIALSHSDLRRFTPQSRPTGRLNATSPDCDIYVKRNRSKTKKFFVTGIDENVKECQILSFLNKRNIIPTYISIFKSRRRGTISSKIHVPSAISSLLQEDNFWPKYISCKPWKSKETQTMWSKKSSTHLGKYST